MCGLIAEDASIIPLVTQFNTVAYRSDRLNANVAAYEPVGDYVRFISECTPVK